MSDKVNFDNIPEDLREKVMEDLKATAIQLGVSFHPNISYEKLYERVAEAKESKETTTDQPKVVASQDNLSKIEQIKQEALKLVRIRITCMNPMKNKHEGEIFMVGNSLIPTQRKYVPYGKPWHVPQIILNNLKERKFLRHTSVKENGVDTSKPELVPEYAIEVLPPLTEDELHKLRQRQLMASGTKE